MNKLLVAKKEEKIYLDKNKRRKKQKIKSRNTVNLKLSALMYSIMVACVCILLLSRYAHITEIRKKTAEANASVIELEERKHRLNLELEDIKKSGWIEEQASLRMNMRKAKGDQIVYLDVNPNLE